MEWDPHAMKNTSILIIVITCLPRTSAASLFLYLHLSPTDRDTHKHAADTFQIVGVTAEEKINPAFRHHTPVLMESRKGRDKKITFQCGQEWFHTNASVGIYINGSCFFGNVS